MSKVIGCPPLRDITEACLSASERGWTREDVKKVLQAHQAACRDKQIIYCPVKRRKALLSALHHHPTWWSVSVAYCARLNALGFPYPKVKAACQELGWDPPSMVGPESREILAKMLKDPESRVRLAIQDLEMKKGNVR